MLHALPSAQGDIISRYVTSSLQQRLARPCSLGWAIMLHALPSAQGDIISSARRHHQQVCDVTSSLQQRLARPRSLGWAIMLHALPSAQGDIISRYVTSSLQQRLARPRSLGWAIMPHALPSAQGDIVSSITTHRNYYNDLKAKLSMDPRAVIGDDPLSQDDESVWKQHFCDNELKAIIMQDVVRTFPDELYFRDQDVQDMMVRILFFWARSHAHVGYRQGMHEILAPVLFELFQDRRFAPRDVCDVLKCFLDDDYLEHDSYMLFNAVMKGLERFYSTGDVVPSKSGRLPTSKVVHNPNEVVRYLDKVKEEFLVPLDHELAAHLHECNITMELFGIRWLRLLFGREFPRGELAHLWGFLFADGPALPHLHFVVLAMLISIRTTRE
ncbi:TBC1 domain family member 5 [Ostrinia nubilalis]|uniref:TBC1 domain family member 5 n=1 Tax=Ostrinia nubilalis TaxID=29057 RepID=UPI0030822418